MVVVAGLEVVAMTIEHRGMSALATCFGGLLS
jgi:hypothetical protein